MIILPVPQQAPPPTARSRELGKRIDDLVRDFKRDHPDVTDDELRSALLHSAPNGRPDPTNARRSMAILGATAAVVAGGIALIQGSTRPGGGGAWMFIVVAAALAGLAFAVIQFARRD